MTCTGRSPRAAGADRAVIARCPHPATRHAVGVPSDRARRSSADMPDCAVGLLDDVLDALSYPVHGFWRARRLRDHPGRDAECEDAADGRTHEQVSKHVASHHHVAIKFCSVLGVLAAPILLRRSPCNGHLATAETLKTCAVGLAWAPSRSASAASWCC